MKIMKTSVTWTWHLLAGVALAFLLGMHMFIMHLDDILNIGGGATQAVSFAEVMQRGQQAAFMVTYILLLGAALYHGLYGLRTIIFELTLAPRVETMITTLFVVIGVALFVYGTVAAVSAYNLG
jgi:succinate dehydrogenase / fumarate reductase membrane anchor subunit